MKVAIAPGVWRDDGPQSATSRLGGGFVVRPVLAVGSMIPILSTGSNPVTSAETARRRRRALRASRVTTE
jgi:hypothetical protein